jgi:hypothetical protein
MNMDTSASNHSSMRRYADLRTAWLVVGLLFPLPSVAVTELVLQLESSLRYDSNPLRFTQAANVNAALGSDQKSAWVVANEMRGALVYPLDSPETRVVMTGSLGRRSYSELIPLDNTEYTYKGALEWRFEQLWKGVLFHNTEQQLYNYIDGSLATLEMLHRTTDNIELALRITPDLDVPLVVRSRHTRYDTLANAVFNNAEYSVDMGIRLKSPTFSNLRLGLRATDTLFPDRTAAQITLLDTRYRDTEAYVEADWVYSALTRVTGRIAALKRQYNLLNDKSFSVLPLELQILRDYSPMTKFTLDLWSRPYGAYDRATLYTIAQGAQIGVRWLPTVKTRFALQVTNEYSSNQSAVANQSNAKLKRVRVGGNMVHALTRNTSLFVDGFTEHLDRGVLGAGIQQNTVRVGLEYTFENMSGMALRNGLGQRK